MSKIETNAKALVDAIEANDNDAAKAAVQTMLIEVGSLLERAVVALETIASVVDLGRGGPSIRAKEV